ncbi:MAG: proline dehydrogenase family protein [Bacteroidia bacterium]
MVEPKLNLQTPDFNNTEIAFKSKTDGELINSYYLFKAIGYNWLVKVGPSLVETAFKIKLPIKRIIKKTVFKQFCGGESIDDCSKAINQLHNFGVGTILDYSVEGEEREEVFEATKNEILKTIEIASKEREKIPFSVFKTTGVARFALLEKVSAGKQLTVDEENEFLKAKERINQICNTAYNNNVRIFIDAEESWIQQAIDDFADEMMALYNKQKAIVYNTIQLYRHDRLAFLKKSHQKAINGNYFLGVKLVRGAYMEKERLRAQEMNYQDPIQPNKQATDHDYDEALKYCIENINNISICAGTHNEHSSALLTQLMQKHQLKPNDERIYFSQLYGMSDNLSFNLSNTGFKVAKYLPYGPVKAVLPYLFRRAQENTSVKGQAGRELSLILQEIKRRKHAKK